MQLGESLAPGASIVTNLTLLCPRLYEMSKLRTLVMICELTTSTTLRSCSKCNTSFM